MYPVLFRDRHLEVIDKPAGRPVIPGRQGGGSIAEDTGLLVCHRLDTDTSGVLVLARTAAGHRIMNRAFAEGRMTKEYAAVVAGEPPDDVTVDLPIGEWRRGRVSVGQGKAAQTRFCVRWRDGPRTGVLALPVTGRTHQIRAHAASLGAPLVGDPTYGGPAADRLYLHAWRITLPWPGEADRLVLQAPLPPGFDA